MTKLISMFAAGTAPVPESAPGALGIGAYALMLVAALLLGWMTYLFLNSRQSRATAHEAAAPNLSPGATDDELENRKLTSVLRAALLGSALLAIAMPWYAMNEPGRQQAFAEETALFDADEGAHWYSLDGFQCALCHGPTAGGGAAVFSDARSGVDTSWAVPSLDDVLYRYSEDEIRHWIVSGRQGTPMPANGLDGGGAMTVQEIDQVIDFLRSIQVPQDEAFARSEGVATRAISTMESGQAITAKLLAFQQVQIDDVNAAAGKVAVVGTFPDDVAGLLGGNGTCTAGSAELVGTSCDAPGQDTDRDGLTDAAEAELTLIAATAYSQLTEIVYSDAEAAYTFVSKSVYEITFDSGNAYTNGVSDLDEAEAFMSSLNGDVLLASVTADRADAFLAELETGRAFLEESLASQPWMVDIAAKADEMGVSAEDAELAVGLFNGFCARCHTAGYSAGPAFVQGAGTGAWGPSLVNGRALIQFPSIEDQIAFVSSGTDDGKMYGTNGLGSGRMPGFGMVLSERQIELIVMYERTL